MIKPIIGICGGGKETSISHLLQEAIKNDINSLQTFTVSTKGVMSKDINEEDALSIQKTPEINVISHASLMMNLTGTPANKLTFSINSLITEYKRCEKLGIETIVVHPGSNEDTKTRIQLLANSLKSTIDKSILYNYKIPHNICIETMVGSGNQLCSTPEEFKELFEYLDLQNFKICLDTAHMWGAGYRPLEFWNKLCEYNLHTKVKVIHFNNTASALGSKKERHTELTAGVIPIEELKEFISAVLKSNPEVLVIEEQPTKEDRIQVIENLKNTINSIL